MKHLNLLGIILIFFLAISCKKKAETIAPSSPQSTPYYIRMTDAPGPYTAVNVDIQSVVITGNGNNVTLNTNAGIYNLLNFSNGADTLIASAYLTTGSVEQIRLILGPNNSVVVGGTSYPLTVPSGEESGLKLQVHHTLQAGVAYQVLLDFDAYQSIVVEGNGSYHLKPVIRTIETALGGSIKGHVAPAVPATITATSAGGASYSTVANSNGYFVLGGLPAGTYTIVVVPVSPYNTATIQNVAVTTGVVTDLGQINL